MSYRVIHFEIQADDLDRAKNFYAKVFGWEFVDYSEYVNSPYWGILTAPEGSTEPGINGGMLPRPVPVSSENSGTNAFVGTIGVTDYDTIEKQILDHGGRVALPKYALPGMAWQGYYLDTEGNTFGIHMPDETAK